MKAENRGRKKVDLPLVEIKEKYLSGYSVLALSKEFCVSRDTIHKRLDELGVSQRNQSDAALLRMSKLTEDERAKITRSANIAVTGKKLDPSIHIKRAETLQQNPYEHYIGVGESEFKEMLESKNIEFTWQKAVDIYSIDFMVGNVAVELRKASCDRGYIGMKKGRTKYLKELGIITFYVSFQDVDCLKSEFNNITDVVNELNNSGLPNGKYASLTCRWQTVRVDRNTKGQFESREIKPFVKSSFKILNY